MNGGREAADLVRQRIHLSVALDAFENLAAKDRAFVYPIAHLKLPK